MSDTRFKGRKDIPQHILSKIDSDISDLIKKRDRLKAKGICPSCEGNMKCRVTRFHDPKDKTNKTTQMEDCLSCKGTGLYDLAI